MDYREKQSVLLALYRNLYCPFCRRQMSQLALSAESLEKAGVATLAVVATTPERALVLSVPSPRALRRCRSWFEHAPSVRVAARSQDAGGNADNRRRGG